MIENNTLSFQNKYEDCANVIDYARQIVGYIKENPSPNYIVANFSTEMDQIIRRELLSKTMVAPDTYLSQYIQDDDFYLVEDLIELAKSILGIKAESIILDTVSEIGDEMRTAANILEASLATSSVAFNLFEPERKMLITSCAWMFDRSMLKIHCNKVPNGHSLRNMELFLRKSDPDKMEKIILIEAENINDFENELYSLEELQEEPKFNITLHCPLHEHSSRRLRDRMINLVIDHEFPVVSIWFD